jgi:hypothetical protein
MLTVLTLVVIMLTVISLIVVVSFCNVAWSKIYLFWCREMDWVRTLDLAITSQGL